LVERNLHRAQFRKKKGKNLAEHLRYVLQRHAVQEVLQPVDFFNR
jgi:hypothetical protein